ncbi:MAG: histidine kinase [Planctomycetota bacterium]
MDSSQVVLALRRSAWARVLACALLVVALGLVTSLIAPLLPEREGLPTGWRATASRFVFWTVWVFALGLTLSVRGWALRRWRPRPLVARAALEAVSLGTYTYGLAQLTWLGVGYSIDTTQLPLEVQRSFVPFMVIRAAILYGFGLLLVVSVRGEADRQEQARALRDQERLEAHLVQTQLEVLRSQVRPHFLFNALHAIGGLMLEGDTQQAHRALMALATLLRSTFRHDEGAAVTVAREVALIEEYLALEKLRLAERLHYECVVDPAVRDEPVPPLLLLPVVENAVRHGIAPRPGGGTVGVEAAPAGADVCWTVLDDGVGFTPAPEGGGQGTGIGLRNCSERLQATYGERGRLQVDAEPEGGTRVTIRLPRRGPREVPA